MSVWTAPENERGPDRYQSLKILSGIVSRYLYKLPSEHHPHDHQKRHADTSLETLNGISIPLHYDSYECIRSNTHFTPQTAGNATPKGFNRKDAILSL